MNVIIVGAIFPPFEKTQSTVSCILSKITVEHGRAKLIISVLPAASLA